MPGKWREHIFVVDVQPSPNRMYDWAIYLLVCAFFFLVYFCGILGSESVACQVSQTRWHYPYIFPSTWIWKDTRLFLVCHKPEHHICVGEILIFLNGWGHLNSLSRNHVKACVLCLWHLGLLRVHRSCVLGCQGVTLMMKKTQGLLGNQSLS